jgi:type IV pilus assembly protein PilQ
MKRDKNPKTIFQFFCFYVFLFFTFFVFQYFVVSVSCAQDTEPVLPPAATPAAANVTLDFKDADIRSVLKIISYKAGVNIVASPEVMGTVTIRLQDVPWEKALDAILKMYGFGYEKKANIITVFPLEELMQQKKKEAELAQIQPTHTEVFNLEYLDALDAKKALEPLLSERGKITVVTMSGQAGWEFGAADLSKRKREETTAQGRSKVLIVSDIPPVLDKIKEVIRKIDAKPQQVIIETRIMEVNRDRLKDIGFDWGTGTGTDTGARGTTITGVDVDKTGGIDSASRNVISQVGGNLLGSQVAPSIFAPESTGISGTEPYNAGLEVLFKKLTGAQFEALLHALEEDVHTNTLSAPRIMALSNQEASILVGTKYPILKTDTSTGSAGVVTTSLDYYQDIGIQLNVVPQISADNYINMVIHPAVSSFSSSTTIGDNQYPIITVREAETRILMKDTETVVIGGLLKDIKSKSVIGVPFLSKIPILGIFFRRDTTDTEKIDLLIFISAHIVKDNEFPPEEIARLKQRLIKSQK